MIETEYALDIYKTATIVNGQARIDGIGPDQPFERWKITSIQVSNNGASRTRLEIFRNMSLTQLVEGSYSGNLDTTDTQFDLLTNQNLYFRWLNGTNGSICTLAVTGRKYVQGNRGGR